MGQVRHRTSGDRIPRVLPHVEGLETAAELAARTAALASVATVPVAEPLAGLFSSGGLERGQVYGVRGGASVSLVYSLTAEATRLGSWFAMVDLPRAGLVAAEVNGVAMQRLVSVAVGARAPSGTWARAVGAIVDGFDVVAVASPRCTTSEARRLAARTRASGAVLFVVGAAGAFEPDAVVSAATRRWSFDAHARSRTVDVECTGRRVRGVRRVVVAMPGPLGRVAAP